MTTFTQRVAVDVEIRQMPCGHFVAATEERWEKYDDRTIEGMKAVKCPEGHSWIRIKSEVAILQEQLANELRLREIAQTEAVKAWTETKKARKELDGALTELGRTHRRIQAGVCPYCHRTFRQVQRHMGRKHPERPGVVAETTPPK